MRFINSYARLPESFYERIQPARVTAPRLIRLNRELADSLELDLPESDEALAAIFTGNTVLEGSEPIAQAYAGHQFGQFVPQLGDGRAVLLGEVQNSQGDRFDIQLKGSGRTRYSRGGDGRSPLGPVIREYVVSEAMHALNVPTTRALAMAATGETVFRETPLPGAVMTRVASGFVRVGTFEFFAARQDMTSVKTLADYVLERHYPEVRRSDNPYVALFESVCRAQAQLVARWMCVGFIHGVINTDNTSISGETIDFGPCAFMDHYDPTAVFSSIDHMGRYAFNQQPTIAAWNLACLGGCLVSLFDTDPDKAQDVGKRVLDGFVPEFTRRYTEGLCAKIGLPGGGETDFELARELLRLMHRDRVDFTNAFRLLCEAVGNTDRFTALFSSQEDIRNWIGNWHVRLDNTEETRQAMRRVNPAFIPRNHRLEQAIRAAEDDNDFTLTHRLLEVLARPYEDQPENTEYAAPPQPEERVTQTFCGT
ncbi:YdiU family protein [Pseudodesulfovibrio sp. S3]|nr:YdiU family protein [Pseudodesulfovibrio sp. S3-i]RWU02391.1 YdiU family protein [Pseudodesulfovibrio sp. S3]